MVRQRWPEVLETLAHIRRASWVLVAQSATVGEISGGEMKLVFETAGLSRAFASGHHDENVAAAVKQTLGLDVRVTATTTGDPGVTSQHSAAGAGPANATSAATPSSAPAGSHPEPAAPAPPEPYDEMEDLETSVDIDQPLEYGVPVIQRLLGGRIVEGDSK